MNISPKLCRFCASSVSSKDLLDLTSSLALFEDVEKRLKLLGINFVNLYEEGLPKSICASCYFNLKKCCLVFERIKDSQRTLRQLLFLKNEGTIEKGMPNSEIITQGNIEDFFDFDCPRLMSVDESTREIVKTLALLPLHGRMWQFHDARPTQQPQNAGEQQQTLNLPIVVQQPQKPAAKEKHSDKPGLAFKQHVGMDQQLVTLGMAPQPQYVDQRPHKLGMQQQPLNTSGKAQYPLKQGVTLQLQNEGIYQQSVKSGMVQHLQKAEIAQHLSMPGMVQHPVKQGILEHGEHDLAKNTIPHWSTNPKKCDKCGLLCKTVLALKTHHRLAHGVVHEFQCPDSDIMVPTFQKNIEHLRDHRPELIFKCKLCNFVATDNDKYVAHINEHKMEPKFPKFGDLLHEISALNAPKSNFPGTQSIIRAPEPEEKRLKVGEYTCDTCGMSFARATTLRRHKTTIHSNPKNHGCNHCGKTFFQKRSLDDHKFNDHKISSYVCEMCSKPFKTFGKLKEHEDLYCKSVKCDQCSRRFRHPYHLKSHMQMHKNGPSIKCRFCSMRFKYKSACARHERKVHSALTVLPFSNLPIQMAVDRPLSPKTKAKMVKDSILEDWAEILRANKDEVDELDKNDGNTRKTGGKM